VAVIEKKVVFLLKLGCIPTKALLKSAQVFYLKHASDYGLTVSSFDKDFRSATQ
jgi:dihydrolipoamide dehydrogenase